MGGRITVVAELQALRGLEDRLRTALEAMIEPSLGERGCLSYGVYADLNRPGRMTVVTEWSDAAALAAHEAGPHTRHLRQVLDRVLTDPALVRRLVAAPEPDGASA
ncbi:antibiotic biosynthesis monooxygenase [Streptomyces sp. NPDC051940]|uniref:putative quinol monooxygenase n=1 Tax=Streptomyces sp. NPDC051940 TaxID=3155675 RepID=UPI003412DDF2